MDLSRNCAAPLSPDVRNGKAVYAIRVDDIRQGWAANTEILNIKADAIGDNGKAQINRRNRKNG